MALRNVPEPLEDGVDRQLVAGKTVCYSLGGPAEHLIARLQQIIANHPELDPRDIRGSLMLTVSPGLAEAEAERILNLDEEEGR